MGGESHRGRWAVVPASPAGPPPPLSSRTPLVGLGVNVASSAVRSARSGEGDAPDDGPLPPNPLLRAAGVREARGGRGWCSCCSCCCCDRRAAAAAAMPPPPLLVLAAVAAGRDEVEPSMGGVAGKRRSPAPCPISPSAARCTSQEEDWPAAVGGIIPPPADSWARRPRPPAPPAAILATGLTSGLVPPCELASRERSLLATVGVARPDGPGCGVLTNELPDRRLLPLPLPRPLTPAPRALLPLPSSPTDGAAMLCREDALEVAEGSALVDEGVDE